jgi:hypothetical protein
MSLSEISLLEKVCLVDGESRSIIAVGASFRVDPAIGQTYKLSRGGPSATNVSLLLITNQTLRFNIDPFSGIQGQNPHFLTP